MGEIHDLASGLPAHASASALGTGADVLSDVLRAGKLTGALFFMIDAAPPWQVAVPKAPAFAPLILPRARHIISYHVVTQGSCWGALLGEPPVAVSAGDILVFPHGDAYVMYQSPPPDGDIDFEYSLGFFRSMAAGELPFAVREGGAGAERLGLVCGFLGCDARPFNPLLATLPRMLHLRGAPEAQGDLLGRLVELTLAEVRSPRSGGECMRLGLSELMFVEVVRRHLATLPAGQTGWLAGLRDPAIGRVLALLHERPAEPWTLERLAGAAALSRSALAERFAHLVGQPPMQYLTQWRMQLAARRLADGGSKVAAVALEVGYASEAAFSRAFKKLTGASPAQWRRRSPGR